MTPKQAALIEKLDAHPGGPITLTQGECLILGKTIEALIERIDDLETALRIVSTGIWRNRRQNTCGLAGGSVAIHAVESALGKRKLKK